MRKTKLHSFVLTTKGDFQIAYANLFMCIVATLVVFTAAVFIVESARNVSRNVRDKAIQNSLRGVSTALDRMCSNMQLDQRRLPLVWPCTNGREQSWRVHMLPYLADPSSAPERSRKYNALFNILCVQADLQSHPAAVELMPELLSWLTLYAVIYDGDYFSPVGFKEFDEKGGDPVIVLAIERPSSSWMKKCDVIADRTNGSFRIITDQLAGNEVEVRGCWALRYSGAAERVPDLPEERLLEYFRSGL